MSGIDYTKRCIWDSAIKVAFTEGCPRVSGVLHEGLHCIAIGGTGSSIANNL